MSNPTGPFAYVRDIQTLASVLGTSRSVLDTVSAVVAQGKGYSYRVKNVHRKERKLSIPDQPLFSVQSRIYDFLWPLSLELHPSCHGYVPGKSNITNAFEHVGQSWVQRLDIAEFYPSTGIAMIAEALEHWGATRVVAEAISDLVTDARRLPLGPPTSPILSNLILHPIDLALDAEARIQGLKYSRYADDLTFSGSLPFDISPTVASVLAPLGYELNAKKTRVRKKGQRIIVTGLTVAESDRPRLPKQYKRRLRQEFYFIERFGIEEHCSRKYFWPWIDEEDDERQLEQSRRHLYGKVHYAFGVEHKWTTSLVDSYPGAASELVLAKSPPSQRSSELAGLVKRIRQRSGPRLSTEPRTIGI